MTHILYHFAVCYVWQDSSGVIHVSGLDIVAGGYILRFSIMIDSNFYIGCSILFYIWGIERSGFFNGREKWAKGFENQRV